MHTKNKFEWCIRKGKEGSRGLIETKPDLVEAKFHLEKALYNLQVTASNIERGYLDWAVSSSFYAMYHAVLALLAKVGYRSTNQECSIAAIEYFIIMKKIPLDIRYIKMLDPSVEDSIIKLRERFQYGTEATIQKEVALQALEQAKEFVEKCQECL